MRQVVIYPDETGMWVAECPSLPGCISQGETFKLAVDNIRDAIHEYIESLKDENRPIPDDTYDARLVMV